MEKGVEGGVEGGVKKKGQTNENESIKPFGRLCLFVYRKNRYVAET